MPTLKSYDPRCEELAEHFLADKTPTGFKTEDERIALENRYKVAVISLARSIQTAVEDWFEDYEE